MTPDINPDYLEDPTAAYCDTLAGRLRYLAAQLEFLGHQPDEHDILLLEEAASALDMLEGDT